MKILLADKAWKRLAALAAGLLVAAVMYMGNTASGWPGYVVYPVTVGMGIFAAAALGLRVRITSRWFLPLVQLAVAVSGILLMHVSIEAPITEKSLIYDLLICTGLIALLQCITGSAKAADVIYLVFCWGFSLVNQAVKQFRGSVINFSDIYSIDTALSVAEDYSLEFNMAVIMNLVLFVCCMALIIGCRFEFKASSPWKARIAGLLLGAVLLAVPFVRADSMRLYYWGTQGARYNGILMQLLIEAKSIRVSPPEGYSTEKALSLLEDDGDQTAAEGEKPHIIVIMNEAFSDLSVLGEFETNMEVLPFFNSLKDESIHGYAASSVYGGSTANSEWEYLTANTMGFLPANTVPYRLYVDENTNSMVNVLANQGYKCIAMHPYKASGWSRDYIYPRLGFDEIYFQDDLDWGDRVRRHVSDSAFMDQVIAQFENREQGKPLFLFGVTMQNHGGYGDKKFQAHVQLQGLEGKYSNVNQFLSLMNLSDQAFEELISYFRGVDERVEIVMFGDHQPRLGSAFYAEIGAQDNRSASVVPFIIWRNYASEEREITITSLNYLPALTLEAAGLPLPAYHSYLLDLMQEIPAVNSQFYVDGETNVHSLQAVQKEHAEALNGYRMLQYANMFDEAADDSLFAGNNEE